MKNWFLQHWKSALSVGFTIVMYIGYIIIIIISETKSDYFDLGILILIVIFPLISIATSLFSNATKHSLDIVVFDYDEIITRRLFKTKVYKWEDVSQVSLRQMDISSGAKKKYKEKLTINVQDAYGNCDAIYMDNRKSIQDVIREHYDLDDVDLETVKSSL